MTKHTDTFLHFREGKTQSQRFLEELNPENLQLNDLDVADWLLFAFNFAQHLNYFDKENPEIVTANWQDFFDHFGIKETIKQERLDLVKGDVIEIPRREEITYKKIHKNIHAKLAQFEKEGTLTPHLVLFISFLKILEYSKGRFNNLTKRHLDFYYKDILQIEKKEAVADRAYVIFELAKKAVEEKIPEGTLLDAKKDANGKKRVYKVTEDIIANQAQVMAIKSFLKDDDAEELKIAPVVNSLDGVGEELNENTQYWWPFGYNSQESNLPNSPYKELPDAVLGFAVASPLLNLQQGTRTVTVIIKYKSRNSNQKIIESFSANEIKQNIEVVCSGEKEWLQDVNSIQSVKNEKNGLTFTLVFPADFSAIMPYTDKLSGGFTTKDPMLRFLIKGDRNYELYEKLAEKEIESVGINVSVTGLTDLMLENDNGTINAKKPFYPFTAQPIVGSNFIIKSEEVFTKNWDTINVKIKWKNTPEVSFNKHYDAYIAKTLEAIPRAYYNGTGGKRNSVVTGDNYFTSKVFLRDREVWNLKNNKVRLFTRQNDNTYETSFSVTGNYNVGSADAIRLSLNQSFLQEIYPILYTLTITGSNTNPPIPTQAYVPLIETIEIGYTASEVRNNTTQNERLSLFLEDAFGFYEEKNKLSSIVPVHNNSGELYIGINALPGQQVSLLVQNVEGSENPERATFTETDGVQWHILSGNRWKDLSDDIITNETENFLQSGIIRFGIPRNIDTNNTRLTEGLVWLKASMNKAYDAVCKTKGIYTQAVVAHFENQENELSHLEDGLPANTIEKLQTRIPKVKKVQQPYNTINGISEESDLEYYRRISERLRHKNRAITQWDYEQLILQNFPEIFKVKCLNHTSETSFMAPGYVTVIVVPGTNNKNIFDIYQPRVSQNTLRKVSSFINDLNTMQVEAIVMSPEYQEIEVDISVKFYKEFDDHFYSKQLDEDIKRFISPWAFKSSEEISFDVAMNRYQMINYLEQLEYVDYIESLKIFKIVYKDIPETSIVEKNKERNEQKQALIQADPKSILVSAKKHQIFIATKVCPDINSGKINTGISKIDVNGR
ncbi:baseplate J/gp47 family protein [Aquimarina sp. 2201CG1-2-11]|uniref:baseplate J/gp47 family protein n=1 Tax=Aquimarina discodermiae TaxID=3231043 RepID=UPI003462D37E